jgi:hypothetical protein
MRTLLLVCTGLVVISGLGSATLWLELRDQRKLVADLSTQLSESNTRIQASLASLGSHVLQAPAAAPTENTSVTRSDGPVPAQIVQPVDVSASPQDALTSVKKMMADPEYRKGLLAQQRMYAEINHPGLVEELGLSQKEADHLLDMMAGNQTIILSETQMTTINELNAHLGGGGGQQDQDGAIAALLGPDRHAQWQDYQQTVGARRQAALFGSQLAQTGQPLSDFQQRSLTAALIAEQKRRQRQQTQTTVRNVDQADPPALIQLREDLLKREEEANRLVPDVAAAHLNARQIASLKQRFEAQAAMSAARLRAEKRHMEAQGSGLAGTPVPERTPLPAP